MSITTWAAILVIAFALAYVLRESLEHLIQRSFALLYSLLGDVVQGLQQARAVALNFWHEHFGPAFGVRPLLGGLLAVGVWALLTLADFKLLMLTIDSLLPSGEETWQLEVAGRVMTAGEVTALAVIAFEFLLGMCALDLLGVTDFFMFHRTVSPRVRKGAATACMVVLVLMCAAQAGLAIWRTDKMADAARAMEFEEGALLSSGAEQSSASSTVASGVESVSGRWVDRIPLPAMAMLNFFLPLAAAAAAGGVYPVLVGAAGVAAAVAVLLPLLVAVVLATLVRNAIGYMAEVVLALFSVLTAPGRQIEQVLRRRPDPQGAQTQAQVGATGHDPAHRSETTMSSRDANTRAAGMSAGPGAATVTGRDGHAAGPGIEEATVADVIAALDRNPLGVSDEDLVASTAPHHNNNGGRRQ